MVKRYGCDLHEGMSMREQGPWVHYEDYEQLHALMCRLTDQVNLCELPEGLYDDLEKAGLL